MKNVKKGHKHPIVCLDAGHAGKYNRSPVVPEYYESDMNWKLHNLLADELEGYGIEVRKTRKDQATDLGLYARGEASKGCDLFLSIHSNAANAESADHPLGIYLVPDKNTNIDEMSKELAVLLSKAVQEVMQTKQKAQQWDRLAGKDLNGDGLDNDNYYGVLHGAWKVGTAGVILEHSFHTNKRATKWLLVDANLAKMAKREAEVIAAYFGMTKDSPKPVKPAEPEVEKWYRIRKSWEDAGSQIGAYKTFTNAKNACPKGYTVFDWNGVAVYPEAPAKPAAPEVDTAKEFDANVAGTYKVKSGTGLNLRTGPGVNNKLLETMASGAQVRCYGYHTGHWYLVVSPTGRTGFCSSNYLLKV